jgi:hypothetical protein
MHLGRGTSSYDLLAQSTKRLKADGCRHRLSVALGPHRMETTTKFDVLGDRLGQLSTRIVAMNLSPWDGPLVQVSNAE